MYDLQSPAPAPAPAPAFPRFPEPDDIGRELAARLRQQVLLNSAEEASHTMPRSVPCPGLSAHRRLLALTREAR